jgi:hypothetical protein
MSRGSGRVEQGIIAAFAAEPDNAFTVAELCRRIYPDTKSKYIVKKHRGAIIRAAQSLSKRWPDLGWFYSETLGGQKVFFNADSVMSWAMARLKGDNLSNYDNQDPRNLVVRAKSEDELRTSLLKGGYHHKYIVKGGAWRRHRDMWLAERNGDTAWLKELEAEQERSNRQTDKQLGAALKKMPRRR